MQFNIIYTLVTFVIGVHTYKCISANINMISTKAHVRNAYTYVHTFMYVS